MNEFLAYLLGYGSVGRLYVGVIVLALFWIGVGMTQPRPMLLVLLVTLAVFPASSQLIADGGLGVDIYGKGAGFLFFSVYELSILVLALCCLLHAQFQRLSVNRVSGRSEVLPGNIYFLSYFGLLLLLSGYAIAAGLEDQGSWLTAFVRSGVVYLLFQGALVSAMLAMTQDEESLRRIALVVGVAVAVRMLWGGFRYVALNGDPANYYETASNAFRITFWDINDSVFATMLAWGLVWLGATRTDWSQARRAGLLGFAVFCFLVVALSARRTAQSGALFAVLFIWVLMPRGRRWWVAVLVALVLPVAAYKLGNRMADTGGTIVEKLLADERRAGFFVDPRRTRTYEWQVAKKEIDASPWFGVGPAGRFNPPSSIGLEYHKGNYGFVHSGFGHVLFKTGILGLALFVSLFAVYTFVWSRQWKGGPARYRVYLVASAAGMMASMPNLISGTPIIELRSCLLLGLILAIPLMVARAAHAERYAPKANAERALSARELRAMGAAWGR